MKVAQVSQHYKPIVGGQEVYIANLIRTLSAAGHDSVVFQPDRGVRAPDVIPVPRIHGLPRLIRGSEPYVFGASLWLTRRKQLALSDIIIAHYAFSAWPLRQFAKKTIILSHGIEWNVDEMKWDDRIHERVARSCLSEFVHVVNDTHYLRYFGYDLKPGQGAFTEIVPRKWFIPNCVDIDYFKRNEGLSRLKERKIILVPRQITNDRGIDLAIKAFKPLSEDDDELTLCIMGKARGRAYMSYLLRLIADLDLKRRVFFEPPSDNSKMADFYSSAIVTLIPTLRREGTSLSALESMACGTATVSTDVAGLADLPTVQAPAEVNAFAEAIQNTIRNREAIGERQRISVCDEFNMVKWGMAWQNVIESIAKQQRS